MTFSLLLVYRRRRRRYHHRHCQFYFPVQVCFLPCFPYSVIIYSMLMLHILLLHVLVQFLNVFLHFTT